MRKKTVPIGKFQYSGVEITVNSSGRFVAQIDEVQIAAPSLDEAHKAIDRELKASEVVKQRKVALPVVMLIENRSGARELAAGAVTGINRSTRRLLIAGASADRVDRTTRILADTPSNRELIATVIAKSNEIDGLWERLNHLEIDVPGYGGRISAEEYDGLLRRVELSHKRSLESDTRAVKTRKRK